MSREWEGELSAKCGVTLRVNGFHAIQNMHAPSAAKAGGFIAV
jgi:hypothetical protein